MTSSNSIYTLAPAQFTAEEVAMMMTPSVSPSLAQTEAAAYPDCTPTVNAAQPEADAAVEATPDVSVTIDETVGSGSVAHNTLTTACRDAADRETAATLMDDPIVPLTYGGELVELPVEAAVTASSLPPGVGLFVDFDDAGNVINAGRYHSKPQTEEPPPVDLSRLSENQQFKVRNIKKSKRKAHVQMARPDAAAAIAAVAPAPRPPEKAVPAVPLQTTRARNYLRDAMRSTWQNEKDGIDHLNTSTEGKTKLGRALDLNAHIPFVHPDLGQFASLGGLWYFVGGAVQDEVFRQLHSHECRARGRHVTMRDIKGFRTIIAEATWIKINSHPRLANELRESVLPFRCYFTPGNLAPVVSSPIENWYMPVLEAIRAALCERYRSGDETVFPDFLFLEAPAAKRPPLPRY